MAEEVLDELRRIRDERAARFNYDIDAMYEDLQRFVRENNIKTVSLRSRPVEPDSAEPAADPAHAA